MKFLSAQLSLILAVTSLVSSLPVQDLTSRESAIASVDGPFSTTFRAALPCFLCRMSLADSILSTRTTAVKRTYDVDRDVSHMVDRDLIERTVSEPAFQRIEDRETDYEATLRRMAPFRRTEQKIARSAADVQRVIRRGADSIKRELMQGLMVAGLLADN